MFVGSACGFTGCNLCTVLVLFILLVIVFRAI